MRARGGNEGAWVSGGDIQEPLADNVSSSDVTLHAQHTVQRYDELPAARAAARASAHTKIFNYDFDDRLVMPNHSAEPIDFGGGVWHWLHDDTSTDYDPPGDVDYHGIVGLLSLRGGGGDPNLDGSTDDAAVTCHDADADDFTVCVKCNLRGPSSSDDWTLCSCGVIACEACMVEGCPRCHAKLVHEPTRVIDDRVSELTAPHLKYSGISAGHVQRVVSLFEEAPPRRPPHHVPHDLGHDAERDHHADHLAWADRELGGVHGHRPRDTGVQIAPWARIEGESNGRRTRVCTVCSSDVEAVDEHWHHLRSGRFACPACCDKFIFDSSDHGRSVTPHREEEPYTMDPQQPSLAEAGSATAAPETRLGLDPTRDPDCLNCGWSLAQAGASWRICTCLGRLCETCWSTHGACPQCRGLHAATSTYDAQGQGASTYYIAGDDSDQEPHDAFIDDEWHEVSDHGHVGEQPRPGQVLTPAQAEQMRERLDQEHRSALHARRAASRALATAQSKQGLRPRRPRRVKQAHFVSMNVNCSNRLKDEVMSGDLFKDIDVAFVQEHREQGDGKDKLISWLRHHNWDPVAEDAYLKVSGYGGGPLIMTRDVGIRPMEAPPDHHRGRVCWGETDLNGAVTLGSVYALSGHGIGKQVPLLCHIAQRVVTYGLPCILAGDWQLSPEALRQSDFTRIIDAEVVSTGLPTNVISGSELDYYVISRSLLTAGYNITVDPSGAFSPHVAVRLSLPVPSCTSATRRLRVPRLLPIAQPIGPLQEPQYVINWKDWNSQRDRGLEDSVDPPHSLSALADQWYAAAEIELIELHGLDYHEAGAYRGLGRSATTVSSEGRGRYRSVASDLGLMCQRLAWTSKALWTVISAMSSPLGSPSRAKFLALASTMAPRARAFRRELAARANASDEWGQLPIIADALRVLGKAGLQVRGVPPLLVRLRHADYCDKQDVFQSHYNAVSVALRMACESRHRKTLRLTKLWARCATDRMAHRATKRPDVAPSKSASSSKSHRGELTDQAAADEGIREWGAIWLAGESDAGDDILRQIKDIYDSGDQDDLPLLDLPPITGLGLRRGSLRFRSDTAVGVDCIRPRHFARLSTAALDALARLLMQIEASRRWIDIAREVVEVARGKKTGGARLIGLGASLYRLWARVRFNDVRLVMERRVDRPYLPAAPGKGAIRAVYDMTLTVEAARARGLVAATTSYDLKQYYEHIAISELALGARQFGLPLEITALLGHLYSGPRRVRVGRAVSPARYPRRSILAGCSFALLAIRLIIIKPVERLLQIISTRLKGWNAKFHPMFYVDDGVLTTVGDMDAVAMLHGWITRTVLSWVRHVLHKSIAVHKTTCVASCADLRDRLSADLAEFGVRVKRCVDMLGVDFAAGGSLHARPTQVARRRKAMKRKGRITWLRRLGGPAHKVARHGVLAEHSYGSDVVGLPPAALRDARAVHAASSSISCSGASLTIKLALGGEGFCEHDPAVIHNNPPLGLLLKQVWDVARKRSDFVRAWYQAREQIPLADGSPNWRNVRGPVSAAFAHLLRIGASWPKAFRIVALGSEIDILKVPPRTVVKILAVQARRHMDHNLLRRLAMEHGWDVDAVLHEYRFGIHWDLLRSVLRGKRGDLPGRERRILQVLSSGGFWPEERRWQCGLLSSPLCTACGLANGTPYHRIHDCGAFDSERALRRAAGDSTRLPQESHEPGLAPLLHMALAPFPLDWREEEVNVIEGDMGLFTSGSLYGDGSGHHQSVPRCRTATWALVRLDAASPTSSHPPAIIKGTVGGWEQTVARGELTALIAFLRHSAAGTRYVGDCRYVIEGAENGVRPQLMSSAAADPDLWKVVDILIRDQGSPPLLSKIKSHRGKDAAIAEGEASLIDWHGNRLADHAAKTLDRRRLAADHRMEILAAAEDLAVRVTTCVARGAAMAMSRWPEPPPRRAAKKSNAEAGRGKDGSIDADDAHIIRRNEAGNFECVACRRVAYSIAGARRIANSTCGGAINSEVHQTHSLCTSQGLTWCRACGAFSSRWPRQLLSPCPHRPRSQAQRNVLRRLSAGLMPTTAGYLAGVAQSSGKPADTVDNISVIDQAVGTKDVIIGRNMNSGAVVHGRHGRPQDAPSDPVSPRPRGLNTRPSEHRYFRLDKRQTKVSAPAPSASHTDTLVQRAPGSGPEPRAPSSEQRAPNNSVRQLTVLNCTSHDAIIGHWSGRAAISGAKHPTPCNACAALTRIRCRSCRQGLCIQCIKAGQACRRPPAEQEGSGGPSSSVPLPSSPSHAGMMSESANRRRIRGKQPHAFQAHGPTSHDHHRHQHHGMSQPLLCPSGSSDVRSASPACAVSEGEASSSRRRRHHHHRDAHLTREARSVPSSESHILAPAVTGQDSHHHHRRGSPVPSPSDDSHGVHGEHAKVEDRANMRHTLQEVRARRYNVGVVSSLTSSVLPSSQVCPVVVAACAADPSHGPGPPQQRDKCRSGSVAEHKHQSPTTSLSAAAAPCSVSRAHQ